MGPANPSAAAAAADVYNKPATQRTLSDLLDMDPFSLLADEKESPPPVQESPVPVPTPSPVPTQLLAITCKQRLGALQVDTSVDMDLCPWARINSPETPEDPALTTAIWAMQLASPTSPEAQVKEPPAPRHCTGPVHVPLHAVRNSVVKPSAPRRRDETKHLPSRSLRTRNVSKKPTRFALDADFSVTQGVCPRSPDSSKDFDPDVEEGQRYRAAAAMKARRDAMARWTQQQILKEQAWQRKCQERALALQPVARATVLSLVSRITLRGRLIIPAGIDALITDFVPEIELRIVIGDRAAFATVRVARRS